MVPSVFGKLATVWFVFAFIVAPPFAAYGKDYGSHKIDGAYVLLWIGNPSDVKLSFEVSETGSVQRVPARVVAYGFNAKYITAKRERVGYYYIDRSKDGPYADSTDAVLGPFDETQFRKLQTDLGLPSLVSAPARF